MKKTMTALLLAATMVSAVFPASATTVGGDTLTTGASTDIQMVIENPAPTFTLDIPSGISVDEDGMATLIVGFAMDQLELIPENTKIDIKLDSAGYGDVTDVFAMANENGDVAEYEVYSSSFGSKAGSPYSLGDTLMAFSYDGKYLDIDGDGITTISRYLFVNDFENLVDGVYNGSLTFGISLQTAK